jgi:hypothetical protein
MFFFHRGHYNLDKAASICCIGSGKVRERLMDQINATVIAAAGGAIAVALLDVLIEKDILTRADATDVLNRASTRMGSARGPESISISQFIGGLAQQFANG